MEFDCYTSQDVLIDSVMLLVDNKLATSYSIQDSLVRYQSAREMANFQKQHIGIIYFNEDQDDLFGMDILYEEGFTDLGAEALYDGNVSGIRWQTSVNTGIRGYAYEYAHLNWLKNANYGELENDYWSRYLGRYNVEDINYDMNGNITRMQRQGLFYQSGGSSLYQEIDVMDYAYTGNQFTKYSGWSKRKQYCK